MDIINKVLRKLIYIELSLSTVCEDMTVILKCNCYFLGHKYYMFVYQFPESIKDTNGTYLNLKNE